MLAQLGPKVLLRGNSVLLRLVPHGTAGAAAAKVFFSYPSWRKYSIHTEPEKEEMERNSEDVQLGGLRVKQEKKLKLDKRSKSGEVKKEATAPTLPYFCRTEYFLALSSH